MLEKRWKILSISDEQVSENLSKELGLHKTLTNLLVQRGIKTFQEAKKFFRPSLLDLHNPFLMKDMDKAISRLEEAISKNQKILVYGDYDVDGTTAVSLVFTFLKSFYPNVEYYVPDRYSEGYGISFQGIDYAAENKFSLIIALDCGIKAIDKINYANQKNVDFIICDHHRPGDELPAAVAVLDPKRNDCNYPFKELSGCGVGFKLIQAYAQKNDISFKEIEKYLDYVAISIAADIVPIVGENRILTHFGLQKINSNPRAGIKAILELNNVRRQLTVTDLVFIIAPRINAAGRIETARKAVDLLISDCADFSAASGKNINTTNTERKNIDAEITREALNFIETNVEQQKKKTTVVYSENWHKGVVGIVASRLTEKYYRPTIVLTQSNGLITGSARSVKDFDIYDAIDACSHLLEQFGGHKYAAGLTLKPEKLNQFIQKFEEVVCSTITDELLVPEIEIDEQINFSDITDKFFRVLKQFAPFGPGNMNPVFLSTNLLDKGYARVVGTTHLKMDLYQPENPDIFYTAMGFNMADYLPMVTSKNPLKVCYTIEENEWNGNVSLRLNVKDIKF